VIQASIGRLLAAALTKSQHVEERKEGFLDFRQFLPEKLIRPVVPEQSLQFPELSRNGAGPVGHPVTARMGGGGRGLLA
jgi:hypothetical protein